MNASGFTAAPISRLLVLYLVTSALVASLTDTKYYFHILVSPHLWKWRQWWRVATWQLCYANSTEVLFAVIVAYQMRSVERLWGSRKFLSFLLLIAPYTLLLPPALLALLLRPLTLNRLNYLPSGPTPLLFALLAQYHAAIPPLYTYKVGTTSTSTSTSTARPSDTAPTPFPGLPQLELTLTSKTLHYFLPLQLALSQFPHSILPAATGWAVGQAYRAELLPATGWRVPGWIFGVRRSGARVEALRRRLEAEGGVGADERGAAGTGADRLQGGGAGGEGERRRTTLGGMMGEQFWGSR